jgi:tRNA G46 methylase TrmB
VPYPGHRFAQTDPDRLATVATLFGLQPAAPAACRLLELGCGDGGNLVPMAYALPESAFTGIDLSATAIERAEALRRRSRWRTSSSAAPHKPAPPRASTSPTR